MANEFKIKNGIKFPDDTIQTTAATGGVASVAGKTGAVTLTPADVPGTMSYHGWPVPYEVTLSYNKTTRQVTITPTGSTFDIWVGGVKYTKTGAQVSTAHPNATDQHFLYYNTSGNLEWSTTLWDMKTVSPVCEVYYDTIPADGIALNELHTYKRNTEWHESQHFAIGTFVRSGLEISGYTLNADDNAAVTFQVAAGVIVDEDIEFSISTLADGGPYTILRRSGATGYTWDSTSTVPFLSGAAYISYNQNNGGTWQMTEGANSRWVNYYLYATTALETAKRLFLIPGQAIHSTLSSAQAESSSALDLSGLALAEFVGVWKLTFATGNAYTSTGKVRLVEVNRLTNTKGALSVNLTTTNHALLTGRDTADSHPASAITNTPSGNIAATTVQAAINELDSEKIATSAIGVTVQAYDADIPTVAASQAEMEAGTESAIRSMSPLRVAQAIAALGGTGATPTATEFKSTADWTRPTGCVAIVVDMWGGGGAGGGTGTTNYVSGQGGNAGSHVTAFVANPPSALTVTIGAGGTGGSSSGPSGGNTTITGSGFTTITAAGGRGGLSKGNSTTDYSSGYGDTGRDISGDNSASGGTGVYRGTTGGGNGGNGGSGYCLIVEFY